MITRKDLTLEEIKELMKPLASPNHNHTALIKPEEGRRAISLALLRWAGGAKQVTLTQWELPPDAAGRIYTVDTFIGAVVDTKYTPWSKKLHRGTYIYTGTSHTKGDYKTFPHVMLDYIDNSKKRRHYRPMVHTVIAYVTPLLREQYAQAVLLDMEAKDRTFLEAQVQVNHMDKNVKNNSLYNLEVVTASENGKHKFKTKEGIPYSAICDRPEDLVHPELREFDQSGIMDARKAYLDKLCSQLSAVRIRPDSDKVLVQSVTGEYVSVPIKGLTAWGILVNLFLAQTVQVIIGDNFTAWLEDAVNKGKVKIVNPSEYARVTK